MPPPRRALPLAGLLALAGAAFAAAPPGLPPARRAARADLAALARRAAAPDADNAALWRLWGESRRRHPAPPEYFRAAAVMAKVPSPLDKLRRRDIPQEARPAWLPQEVVAVLGEHRGRHWG